MFYRLFALFSLIFCSNLYGGDIWLTWQNDPTSTMVISWLSSKETKPAHLFVSYRKYGSEDDSWSKFLSTIIPFPADEDKFICYAELLGLEADTEYEFRIKNNEEIYRFKTAPNTIDKPISFIVGGDTLEDNTSLFKVTNKRAAKYEPLFVAIGGDIAYAVTNTKEDPRRWQKWLEIWFETMRIDSNRLIPIVAVPGNHDVRGGFDRAHKDAETFYALFRSPTRREYTVLRFGTYLSLYLLDSGHAIPVNGVQKVWLQEELKKDALMLHRMAVYHVPAYPSVSTLDQKYCARVRKHWPPIFDKYDLHFAFENHDHAYKRTHPLRNNKVNSKGVVYIGDGSWGTNPRLPIQAPNAQYLAETRSEQQFCYVTISKKKRSIEVVTPDGRVLDKYSQTIKKK